MPAVVEVDPESVDLGFLTNRNAIYEPEVRAQLKAFPIPAGAMMLWRSQSRGRFTSVPLSALKYLLDRYGWVRIVAAIVVSGDVARDGLNLKHVAAILETWEADETEAQINGRATPGEYQPEETENDEFLRSFLGDSYKKL